MVQINHIETDDRTKRSEILDVLSSIELKKRQTDHIRNFYRPR